MHGNGSKTLSGKHPWLLGGGIGAGWLRMEGRAGPKSDQSNRKTRVWKRSSRQDAIAFHGIVASQRGGE